ncbi:Rieske (2Fe-2S) protein [Proteobacteria bacterium 005FR1]|nr:Rieske (2Fe-2S) protein [Proteobacteria bacterium 005FR1]
MPDSPLVLCHRDDIPENSSKGFDIAGQQLFAVKKRGRITVYRNHCPHLGLPLNWLPDQFLDVDRELIQCASHGALFRIDNGQCVAGPCAGKSLQSIDFSEVGGQIRVRIAGQQSKN